MILSAVRFANTNQSYDFKLDETVEIRQLVEDMLGMIAQWEHIQIQKDPGLFLLCLPEKNRILDPSTSLAQNGIMSGTDLLLI